MLPSFVFPTSLALALTAASFSAQAEVLPVPDEGHSTGKFLLPLLGPEMARRGINFPLPWGIGVNYVLLNQDISIDNVSIAVNDSDFVNLDGIVEFGQVKSSVSAMNARLDVWVLPFLNIYGMANSIFASRTKVELTEPFELMAGADQTGYGAGFGFTASYGYSGFFGTVDMNWTWNQMSKLNAPIGTFLVTPRFGRNFGQVGPIELALWAGAMYQNIDSNTAGSISLLDTIEDADALKDKVRGWYDGLPPIQQRVVDEIVSGIDGEANPTIHYRLEKRIRDPWNMVIGGEVGLSEAWRVRLEVGFLGRTQFLIGVNYRFGVIKRAPATPPAPSVH